jgi:hypothetical protein
MHAYPFAFILERYPFSTASSMFESSNTINASLPPNSKHPNFMFRPAISPTFFPAIVEPVNLTPPILGSERTFADYSFVRNKVLNSPSTNPPSVNSCYTAKAHSGVAGAYFNRMGFPATKGGIMDLKGIQNGKFQGTIIKTGPFG